MNNDIVPSLLEEIQKQFDEEIKAKINFNKTKAGSGRLYRLSFFCKRIRSFFKKGNTRKYQRRNAS